MGWRVDRANLLAYALEGASMLRGMAVGRFPPGENEEYDQYIDDLDADIAELEKRLAKAQERLSAKESTCSR